MAEAVNITSHGEIAVSTAEALNIAATTPSGQDFLSPEAKAELEAVCEHLAQPGKGIR